MADEEEELDELIDDDLDLDDLEVKLETDLLVRHLVDETQVLELLNNPRNRTRPILSKYEKARILGIRAQQIQSGSRPLVDLSTSFYTNQTVDDEAVEIKPTTELEGDEQSVPIQEEPNKTPDQNRAQKLKLYKDHLMNPIKMAEAEIAAKVCPCLVKRPIPGRDPHNPAFEIYSVNGFKQ